MGRNCERHYHCDPLRVRESADETVRYHAEPSGTFYRYDAKAIGSGSEGAQAELQNEFHKSLTLEEAEVLVLKTLKQVMEEKLDSKNYEDEEMKKVVERLPAN